MKLTKLNLILAFVSIGALAGLLQGRPVVEIPEPESVVQEQVQPEQAQPEDTVPETEALGAVEPVTPTMVNGVKVYPYVIVINKENGEAGTDLVLFPETYGDNIWNHCQAESDNAAWVHIWEVSEGMCHRANASYFTEQTQAMRMLIDSFENDPDGLAEFRATAPERRKF
jgi:hypothetical protein